MKKSYKYIRIVIASIVVILSILAFLRIFYPLNIFAIQLTALAQRIMVDFSLYTGLLLVLLMIVTVLFGRIYCSTLCPLGLYQEFLMLLFHRKMSLQKNLPYKYFIGAIVFGFLFGGTAVLIRYIDPYTLFGSAMSCAWLGGSMLGTLAILVFFKGRFFCSNICPVGMVLGLISKFSLYKIYIDNPTCISCGMCARHCPTGSIDFKNKIVNNETCIKCGKCLGACSRSGIHYGITPKKTVPFNPERRKLLIGGAAVAILAVAVKGGLELSKRVGQKIKKVILPAGAGKIENFANRCLNCNLCVQNCPMKIIKKANQEYSTVHIEYNETHCDYNCHKCSEICPSGAIRRISLEQKRKTQIALATVNTDMCIQCGLCAQECPRQIIIKKEEEYPIINPDLCIGCGTCAEACPVQAITIHPVTEQRIL